MKKTKLLSLALIAPLLFSCNADNTINVEELKAFTPTYVQPENKNTGDPVINENGQVVFDFYEISDFHGAVVDDIDSNQPGLAMLGNYFDQVRANNTGGTILLAGGDMYQGSADSNLTYGNLVTYGMNVIQFDAMTIGNHEFDWGVEWIEDNANRATFPFLAANVTLKGTTTNPDFVSPYTIVTRGDYRIGIIGTIGENIKNTILASAIADFDFLDEVEIVDNIAEELRTDEDCDIVVWTTHNDYGNITQKLTSTVPNVDAIFAAHSHTNYSSSITSKDIPIVETTNYGEAVAHIRLLLNPTTGEVTYKTCETTNVLSSAYMLTKDATIDSIYSQYASKFIDPYKNKVVGSLADDFSITELANFACKTMVDTINNDAQYAYDIVAGFHNRNGGVRKELAAGTLTFGQVYECFPFDNEIVILKVLGSDLARYLQAGGNYSFYRLIELSQIDRSASYYIVTTDFLSSGTNPYTSYQEIIYTKMNVRDVVVDEMKSLSGVTSIGCSTSSISDDDYSGSAFSLSLF